MYLIFFSMAKTAAKGALSSLAENFGKREDDKCEHSFFLLFLSKRDDEFQRRNDGKIGQHWKCARKI